MTQTILHLDASARTENSISRDLTAQIVSRFEGARVLRRDLAQPLPLISSDWIGANFTPAKDRDDVQRDTLGLSDTLVGELVAADVIRTVALESTFDNVATLGLLVVVRILLTWSLVIELEGRLPWQRVPASLAGIAAESPRSSLDES